MKILLVEDEIDLAEGLCIALEQQGQNVAHVRDGSDAYHWLQLESFDLIILDLGLPGLDGFELLTRLRQTDAQTPVLIVTARDAVPDRVHGLNLGADDYLVKPFDLDEFLARTRALLRRASGVSQSQFQLGPLCFDGNSRELRDGTHTLPLTARETTLLEVLLQRLGHVVSKPQIAERLFPLDSDAQLSAVEVYVHRLRKHLKPYQLHIRTVRGLGYLLESPRE